MQKEANIFFLYFIFRPYTASMEEELLLFLFFYMEIIRPFPPLCVLLHGMLN